MKGSRWMVLTVAAGIAWTGTVRAGDLAPRAAPGPTMNTLTEIYEKLTNTLAEANVANQKLNNALAEVQATREGVLSNQQQLAEMQQRLVLAGMVGVLVETNNMVLIPGGWFRMGNCMGSAEQGATPDELPVHSVNVSSFYMDKYEVTSNLWTDVYVWATSNGYRFGNDYWSAKGADHPVYLVDWYDVIAWCNARSLREGFTPCYTNSNGTTYTNAADNSFTGGCNWAANGYRLPTEAEWEKAARGGIANRRFPWDDANTIQHTRANYEADPASYTYDTNPTSGYHPSYTNEPMPYTSPVGSFPANGYGLYDMEGNVMEWCWDWYADTCYTSSSKIDPRGPSTGFWRVRRGGSWEGKAAGSRCADRNYTPPNTEYWFGFRCARGL